MMSQVGHLPFYLDDPRCGSVRVAESRPSLMPALRQHVGDGGLVADHRAILADPEIKAVVISAPRPATAPLTLEALNAGKNVLAEKPMAHTLGQAQCLVDAAAAADVLFSVGYMKRFDPGLEAAKATFDSLIESGRLGRLLLARFYNFSKSYAVPVPLHKRPEESRTQRFTAWPLWPDWLSQESRDTYAWFVNAACHDVNLLRWFLPEAREVVAAQSRPQGAVSALIDADGVPVHLEVAKAAAGRWLEGAEFLFERGRLRFAVPSPMDQAGVARVSLDDEAEGRTDQPIAAGSGWSFARQARGFVDALTGAMPLRNPGAEGREDMRLTEAIWRRMQV